jgi:hypothetical protein
MMTEGQLIELMGKQEFTPDQVKEVLDEYRTGKTLRFGIVWDEPRVREQITRFRPTMDHAWTNMKALCEECGGLRFRRDAEWEVDKEHYWQAVCFAFLVITPAGEEVSVLMPGLPLEMVREGKRLFPWEQPSVWLDYSSWYWNFVVGHLRDWDRDHEEDS